MNGLVRERRHRREDVQPKSKKFIVVFTNGNAASVIATSIAAAKRMTQGSFDQCGVARKVMKIREVSTRNE